MVVACTCVRMGGRLVCVRVTFLMVTGMTNHAGIASNLVLYSVSHSTYTIYMHAQCYSCILHSTPLWIFLTLMYTKRCDTADDDKAGGGGYYV